jgi:hypothetical protein
LRNLELTLVVIAILHLGLMLFILGHPDAATPDRLTGGYRCDVTCRCSDLTRVIEGAEALRHAREHLTLAWRQVGGLLSSGYICPDAGQLWIMDYPQHGSQHGPVRLRVASQSEWDSEKPADPGRPRDDVREGQRWRVVKDFAANGLTMWMAPTTGGFECVIPAGTVVTVEHDPQWGASAVSCVPDNYHELELVFVPAGERKAKLYSGYALVIPLADFGSALTPL